MHDSGEVICLCAGYIDTCTGKVYMLYRGDNMHYEMPYLYSHDI